MLKNQINCFKGKPFALATPKFVVDVVFSAFLYFVLSLFALNVIYFIYHEINNILSTRAGYRSVFSMRYSYQYRLIDIRYII